MKKDLLINLLITATLGVLSFVINRVFSQQLGQEALGLMSLMTQLIAYLNLAELGISSASTYALYKPLAQKNENQINIIVSTINIYYQRISMIILIVGLLVAIFIPSIAKTSSFGNSIYIYWILYVINTAWSYYYAKYSILFLANQEYGYTRLIEGSSRIFVTLLQLFVLLYFQSFLLFVLVLSLQNIINIILYKLHYSRHYPYIKKVLKKDSTIFKKMKSLFWHKIGTLVVFNTDIILLAQFTSLKVVAIYSTYLIVYQLILTIVGILTPVLSPKIGKYIALNSANDSYILWKSLHLLYLYSGTVLVTVSYYMINPFIKLWMGEEYLLPEFTIFLLMINLFINITRVMIEVFKDGFGFFEDIYNPILESIINLVVSFILVQSMGLNGVIIGTICSNIVVIYFLKPLLVYIKCFKKNIRYFLIDYSKFLALSIISICCSIYILNQLNTLSNIDSWFSWISISFISLIVVSIITFVIFILNKDFKTFLIKLFIKNRLSNYNS